MFNTHPPPRSVGSLLRSGARTVARVTAATALVSTPVGLLGRLHTRQVAVPAEFGGGTLEVLPTWAHLADLVAGLALVLLVWALVTGWVGRALHDQAADSPAPRCIQWTTGLTLGLLLTLVVEGVVGTVAMVLLWESEAQWGPLALQGAMFYAAYLLFVPVLLATAASGIAWGLTTPAGPPRAEGHLPLS